MKREKLMELVRRAVTGEGYTFGAGEAQNINGAVRTFPAAWLIPPVVREKTGRREGEIIYRITVHLMALSTSGAEEILWTALEQAALHITKTLASEPEVCAVSNIACTPARHSLTVHGDVSVTLVCDVEMWYYI